MLPRGSSGSWVVDSKQEKAIKVYGALVATDPIGRLWMVPMKSILKDVCEELEATEVHLASHYDIINFNTNSTAARGTLVEPENLQESGASRTTDPRNSSSHASSSDERKIAALTSTTQDKPNPAWPSVSYASDKVRSGFYSNIVHEPNKSQVKYRWICHECGGDNSYKYSRRCTNGYCYHEFIGCTYCEVYCIES